MLTVVSIFSGHMIEMHFQVGKNIIIVSNEFMRKTSYENQLKTKK